MVPNINMQVYFSRNYGIDNEAHRFCPKVTAYFKDKEYSDPLHTMLPPAQIGQRQSLSMFRACSYVGVRAFRKRLKVQCSILSLVFLPASIGCGKMGEGSFEKIFAKIVSKTAGWGKILNAVKG